MCEHGEPRGAAACALCRHAGRMLRDEAIERVKIHADGTWRAAAVRAVKLLAQQRETFTADDALEIVTVAGYTTHDNRAMGSVMRQCQGYGYITPTDQFTASTNKRKHASPTRVWRSLIIPPQIGLFE